MASGCGRSQAACERDGAGGCLCEGRRRPHPGHLFPTARHHPASSSSAQHAAPCALSVAARRAQVHGNGPQLDDELLADPEVQAAIRDEGSVHRKLAIANTDRTALGRVGGAIARLHGDSGFAGTVSLELEARGPRSGPGRARWLCAGCPWCACRACAQVRTTTSRPGRVAAWSGVCAAARGPPDHASGRLNIMIVLHGHESRR